MKKWIFSSLRLVESNHFLCSFFSFDTGLENPISKTIYAETGDKIQTAARFIKLFFPEMTPVLTIVPPFLASLIAVYTTDAGTDAFELPVPMWYGTVK